MWNTVILPILTSLTATGLGILIVWLFNTKRRDDKLANEIARITNKIEAVEAKMDNGFNRATNVAFQIEENRWIIQNCRSHKIRKKKFIGF